MPKETSDTSAPRKGFVAVHPIKVSADKTIGVGEAVELPADEIKKLQALGAVKPAGAE